MDKGRLPIVVKALEAIEDAEPEVATTLFSELHATLTTKVTTEVSPVKRTQTNTVIAQPPAAATTVTTTSTPPKPKQMQAEGSTRRQPQRQRRRLLVYSELMKTSSLTNEDRLTKLK